MSRPAPTLAINDRITHKQHALSEHNELSDPNELDDRIELSLCHRVVKHARLR